MPQRAKLITRSGTTANSTENLAKGSKLQFNEMDGNFIGLRDQSFGVVADDSATIDVKAGDTLYVQGTGGIQTSTDSAGQLTIDGSNLSSLGDLTAIGSTLVSPSNAAITLDPSGTGTIELNANTNITGDLSVSGSISGADITFVGDDSTGTAVDLGETFKFAGAGGVTTAVSGDTLTITGADISGFITASSTDTFTNKSFDANGTGNSITNIEVADLASGVLDTDLATVSASDDTLASAKAIKAYVDAQGGAVLGNLQVNDTTISPITTNDNLVLTANGSGTVVVDTVKIDNDQIGGTGSLTLGADFNNITTKSNIQLGLASSTNAISIHPDAGAGSQAGIRIYDPGNTTADVLMDFYGSGKTTIQSGGTLELVTADSTAATDLIALGANRPYEVMLTTNAAKDLVLSTNLDSNSGTIRITDGANGDISLSPNGTGNLVIDAPIINSATNGNIKISPNGTGAIDVDTSKIINVTDPTSAQDAATKAYVDAIAGSANTGDITFVGSTILGASNSDITIQPNGTADLVLDTDTITVGSGGESIVIQNSSPTSGNTTIRGGAAKLDLIDYDATAGGITARLPQSFTVVGPGTGTARLYSAGSHALALGTNDGNNAVVIIQTGSMSMYKAIDMNGNGISDLADPGSAQDAATKAYVDANVGSANTGDITFVGSTMSSPSNADFTIETAGTGKIILTGLTFPDTDGTADQILGTNGSGVLSFRDPTAINIDGGVADSVYTSVPTIDGGQA